ncbi:MAG: phosphoglycerate kinase [Bacteroidetes bacterium]|nr:phosphoglycerate kinase [Bacteroidota bacterium]
MQNIDSFNFSNKKALIRVDFNVPLNADFSIGDDTRITAAIPTITKILKDGGSVILMSHLGRPKGGPENKYSLKHLLPHLSTLLKVDVKFADDCIGQSAVDMALALKPKEVLLLENLRFYKEEEKGDEAFAKKLAALGDVYVNDAFGTAHRAHASTAVIAKFFEKDKLFGYVMNGEIKSIDKVLYESERPFVAIIGGAKVSDKILIIENLLSKANSIIIGGGMAFTFAKALGMQIGNSLCEEDKLQLALDVLEKAKQKGVAVLLPVDAIAADKFSNDANTQAVSMKEIPAGWMGLDIGKQSEELFAKEILAAKTILWNGPMGVFEMDKFQSGTKAVAQAVAKATENGSFSLIGGGDSVAAINKYNLQHKVSYVSTGGGAMLEYMEGKELPGVAAIKNN